MKAKTLSVAIALSGLMAASGTALADAHGAYQRAFFGDSGTTLTETGSTMGKAAYGMAAATPFAGPKGGIVVLTTNGLGAWSSGSSDTMGKAAFGSGGSGIETSHNGYHRAFYGD